MAKQRKDQVLRDAKSYYQLLLYEASGGVLGKKPDKEQAISNATFAEKRGLLDSIIKVAQMDEKANEGEDQPSGLDIIRRQLNGSGKSGSRGDIERTDAESGSDSEPAADNTDS